MKQFRPTKKRITVSAGESVRIIRELQGLSQNQLAQRTGIPQATLSAIENDPRPPACGARKGARASPQVPSCRAGLPGMGRSSPNCGMTRCCSRRAEARG